MLHCIVNHGRYPTTGRPKLPIGPARSALCRQLYGSSDIMIHHGSIVDSLTRREHAPGVPCPPPRPHHPVSSLRGCWTLACRLSPAGPRTKCSPFAQDHGYNWLSTWHQTHQTHQTQTLAAAAC
ncbi:hypothetical protein GQ607_009639 [Colletotrichum asianum]|uniref:Uncharacterized protein n=1 Tax=Colletotrichum asianum TaxID=702518 RepID=A0A8H3ZTL8_9PEZI|nr:hypothetical protein GQ607_009639 [Colletotrichum asianum]